MFNRALIHELRKENSRLRAELRSEKRRYDELLDRTLFSVRPERVIASAPKNGTPSYAATEAGDMYTKAMNDAVEEAKKVAGTAEPEEGETI
jgi:hypothetical protein